MIIVIQCASSKRADAGRLRTKHGKGVLFVADPGAAPARGDVTYARPDDASDQGGSWRDVLSRYNAAPGGNPLQLSRAVDLYTRPAYTQIADRIGVEDTYILSAGWGLIAGSFLTPDYDITFSAARSVAPYKRRRSKDRYSDGCALPRDCAEQIFFFGGKDYVLLFCKLTQGLRAERTVFYNSSERPEAPGCVLRRVETTARTNWHYGCVSDFLEREA